MFLFSKELAQCNHCDGTGRVSADEECHLCGGTGDVDSYDVTWVAYLLCVGLIFLVGSCLWR